MKMKNENDFEIFDFNFQSDLKRREFSKLLGNVPLLLGCPTIAWDSI
jgi:hypothetical protein